MKTTETITVLLLDDHWLLRSGVKSMLASFSPAMRFEILETDTGEKALGILERGAIDLVLVDHQLEGISGPETVRRLRRFLPAVRVLGLSAFGDLRSVTEMMEAGADGYLLKSVLHNELLTAIKAVLEGKKYFSPEVAELLMDAGEERGELIRAYHLGERELEVLKLITLGLNNAEIASRVFLSRRTVDTHRQNLLQKLRAKNTADLVRKALELGLVRGEEEL